MLNSPQHFDSLCKASRLYITARANAGQYHQTQIGHNFFKSSCGGQFREPNVVFLQSHKSITENFGGLARERLGYCSAIREFPTCFLKVIKGCIADAEQFTAQRRNKRYGVIRARNCNKAGVKQLKLLQLVERSSSGHLMRNSIFLKLSGINAEMSSKLSENQEI